MATTTLSMPLYHVRKGLNVPDSQAEAAAAAEVGAPDLSKLATKDDLACLATKDELRAEVATVRTEIAGVRTEIAASAQRQTVWMVGALFAAIGAAVALQRYLPPPPAPTLPTLAAPAGREAPPVPAQPGPTPRQP